MNQKLWNCGKCYIYHRQCQTASQNRSLEMLAGVEEALGPGCKL
jgi:hypothetical protein